LEDGGDYKAAIALYESALQQDNLIEPFYRGLMRCHHALGETTEALRMYRRCRELFSIVLSTAPAPETELLRAKLGV
jgi:DNA-binding SARP family transcriptional activator